MKIIVDMNLAVRWAKMLTDKNINAIHWNTVGAHSASDEEIMSYARQNGFSVLTNDLDFGAILSSTRASKPSVIQIRSDDTRPETLIDRVVDILLRFSDSIEQGTLITIDSRKARLHILPFSLPEN